MPDTISMPFNTTAIIDSTLHEAPKYAAAVAPLLLLVPLSGSWIKGAIKSGNEDLTDLGLMFNRMSPIHKISSAENLVSLAPLARASGSVKIYQQIEALARQASQRSAEVADVLNGEYPPDLDLDQIKEMLSPTRSGSGAELDSAPSSMDEVDVAGTHQGSKAPDIVDDGSTQEQIQLQLFKHHPFLGYFGTFLTNFVDAKEEISYFFGKDFFRDIPEKMWLLMRACGSAISIISIPSQSNADRLVDYHSIVIGTVVQTAAYFAREYWYSSKFGLKPEHDAISNEKSIVGFLQNYAPVIIFDITVPLVPATVSAACRISPFHGPAMIIIPVLLSGTGSILRNTQEYTGIEDSANSLTNKYLAGLFSALTTVMVFKYSMSSQIRDNIVMKNIQTINAGFASLIMSAHIHKLTTWTSDLLLPGNIDSIISSSANQLYSKTSDLMSEAYTKTSELMSESYTKTTDSMSKAYDFLHDYMTPDAQPKETDSGKVLSDELHHEL